MTIDATKNSLLDAFQLFGLGGGQEGVIHGDGVLYNGVNVRAVDFAYISLRDTGGFEVINDQSSS